MFRPDLAYDQFLLANHPRLFRQTLLEARPGAFDPDRMADIQKQYVTILDHPGLTTDLRQLFDRRILACGLLSPHLVPGDYVCPLPEGLTPEFIRQCRWGVVPVVLAGADKGALRWFILGVCDYPAARGLDGAETIAETAFDRARTITGPVKPSGFMCIPVMGRAELRRMEGDSLVLPLALGFSALIRGKAVSGKVIATGALSADGRIRSVGQLEIKARRAASDFDVLLYPAENLSPPDTAGISLVPVSGFDQAWMFARLYAPEHAGVLSVLDGICRDPLFFSLNVSHLPAPWINWLRDEGQLSAIVDDITRTPAYFSNLAAGLENRVKNYDLARSRALCRLVSPRQFTAAAGRTPLSAMKWSTARLSFANHRGKILDAAKWKQRGEKLIPDIMKIDLNAAADFYNHALVADHNRFCFRPDLPPALERILECLEHQYDLKQSFGCTADPALGRLYGTLMQNAAFCGPGMMPQTIRYSVQARKALGEDTVAELAPEWLRQYSYLAYACLENTDSQNAETALNTYLKVDRLADLTSRPTVPSAFEQALAARFLAENPDHPDIRIMFAHLFHWFQDSCRSRHPWQLISWNLGRIAAALGKTDTALGLLKQSLSLCLADWAGPTVNMMALLPLSQLCSREQMPDNRDHVQARIGAAAAFMDTDHFSILNHQDFDTVLARVSENPQRFFPFTFR